MIRGGMSSGGKILMTKHLSAFCVFMVYYYSEQIIL